MNLWKESQSYSYQVVDEERERRYVSIEESVADEEQNKVDPHLWSIAYLFLLP